MSFPFSPVLGVLALAGAAPLVLHAQTDPPVPPAYRSALDAYQPFQDAPARAWREHNDNVGRIGGWRAYAREAAAPAGAAPPAAPPASQGHAHDGHHAPRAEPPAGARP